LRRLLGDTTPTTRNIWLLNLVITLVAVALAPVLDGARAPLAGPNIPFILLALLFLAGELAVVHLRFRENAHSFSMSDVPMLVGLFFLSPLTVVTAQLLGNLIALVGFRRLPAIKVVFNLAQFAVQTMAAALVLYTVLGNGEALGIRGWAAAFLAAIAAVFVADTLINMAIKLSGGKVAVSAMLEVLGLSSVAASMNVTLALGAVTLIDLDARYWWIGAATPVFLYSAYQAYVRQREEGSRIQGLLHATDALHRAPDIDDAIVTATTEAVTLLDAEIGITVVYTEDASGAFVTAVGPEGEHYRMRQIFIPPGFNEILSKVGRTLRPEVLDDLGIGRLISSRVTGAVGALLVIDEDTPVGYIVACNRVGDISNFGDRDVEVLSALATQLSVSLQNGRLADSLAAATTANAALEDLVESKDQFVASVSHELRTPLTGVVGLARELNENFGSFDGSEVQEVIAMIADQGAELANIIEDLLVAARADIGTLSIAPKDTDLAVELAATLQTQARALGRDGIPVHGTAPTVWADALRLRQIIRNLLTNAARYGGGNIWVEVSTTANHCSVAVMDDGDGVPPGKENAIFEAYESAHEKEGTQPGSFGLGLSVARKIAQMGGGSLTYHRVNGNTAFRLNVPLRRPEDPGPTGAAETF
jgi:signal transduction histidine kinase